MFELMPLSGREKNIFRYFDELEKNLFSNTFSTSTSQIRTDVVDEGDRYVLHAELPGFHREDIKIDLDRDYLTISAQRTEEQEEKQDNYVRRERRTGSFSRSFDITGINTEAIQAKYENGVLSLELPKIQAAPIPPARQIEIQ